ncbi:hypothetical protein KR51_00022320 [Rubidibacter lacunae KORDI 51-2]|uniref:Uncharacterized protein n=1 Tax=Rubidibacter lacunae KORDI 51-2 TaxID=582515 RepID=U5DKT6_9CHRO|nr:hypothetical protein [Rubidibacter lacunae]ERN41169.1 hypothetical protein KR51_00022320 [Rubidibacter lacunae KORDI 51-2]
MSENNDWQNGYTPHSPVRDRAEREVPAAPYSPQTRKTLISIRRFLIGLTVIGIVGGILLAWGLIVLLGYLGLTDPPEGREPPPIAPNERSI